MAREVQVLGLREIQEALKALPAEIASKRGGPLRQGLAKGITVVRNQARANAPVDTGALRDNIVIYRSRDPKAEGHTESYFVLVRHKTAKKVVLKQYRDNRKNRRLGRVGKEFMDRGSLFYAPMVEFGVPSRGIAPNPFMRNAFEAKKGEAVDVAVAHMKDRIAAIVKKLNKGPRR